jgi:hypothetical protein
MKHISVKLTEAQARALIMVTALITGPDKGPRGSLTKAGESLARELGDDFEEFDYNYYVASKEYLARHGFGYEGYVSLNPSHASWPE